MSETENNSVARTIGLVVGVGLMLMVLLMSCASTGGTMTVGPNDTVPAAPWLTPRPLTIYELNQKPETIRHAFVYGELHQFMWALVSPSGVAKYSMMTGAEIPITPCVILTRRTR